MHLFYSGPEEILKYVNDSMMVLQTANEIWKRVTKSKEWKCEDLPIYLQTSSFQNSTRTHPYPPSHTHRYIHRILNSLWQFCLSSGWTWGWKDTGVRVEDGLRIIPGERAASAFWMCQATVPPSHTCFHLWSNWLGVPQTRLNPRDPEISD